MICHSGMPKPNFLLDQVAFHEKLPIMLWTRHHLPLWAQLPVRAMPALDTLGESVVKNLQDSKMLFSGNNNKLPGPFFSAMFTYPKVTFAKDPAPSFNMDNENSSGICIISNPQNDDLNACTGRCRGVNPFHFTLNIHDGICVELNGF